MAHEIGHNLGASHFNDKDNKYQYIMEAKVSTGASGFGGSSSDSILSFLGRKDIRCYQTISALQETTAAPTDLSDPPSTTPSSPVSPPAPSPVALPSPPLDDCYGAVLDALPTCLVPDDDNKFICFNLKEDLIPSSCKVRFFLSDECENFSSSRVLRGEGIGSRGGGDSETQVPVFEGIFVESGSEIIEGTFGADDCTNSCLYSQKQICFSAAQGTSHPISFVVLNEQGDAVGETVSTFLTVEENGSGCAVPDLQCID